MCTYICRKYLNLICRYRIISMAKTRIPVPVRNHGSDRKTLIMIATNVISIEIRTEDNRSLFSRTILLSVAKSQEIMDLILSFIRFLLVAKVYKKNISDQILNSILLTLSPLIRTEVALLFNYFPSFSFFLKYRFNGNEC